MLNETAFNIIEQFFYTGLNRVQTSLIMKKTGYDFKTVKKYLCDLSRLNLITIHTDLSRPTYEANYRNRFFLNIKRQKILEEIFLSGLPEHLNTRFGDTACILFGSSTRGDYYEESDIDMFIQSVKMNLDLSKFERKLKRHINIFFEESWQNLNEGMKTGLLNDGISINGRLKL